MLLPIENQNQSLLKTFPHNMKIILNILLAFFTIIGLYYSIGVATVLKNGTSITQSPGTLTRLKTFFSTHVAETSFGSVYPELQPLKIKRSDSLDQATLINTIKSSAESLGYQLEGQLNSELHFVMTTALFKFKDDVYISVQSEQDSLIVNAKSESRVGRADFGANIANIVVLFKHINQQLNKG